MMMMKIVKALHHPSQRDHVNEGGNVMKTTMAKVIKMTTMVKMIKMTTMVKMIM